MSEVNQLIASDSARAQEITIFESLANLANISEGKAIESFGLGLPFSRISQKGHSIWIMQNSQQDPRLLYKISQIFQPLQCHEHVTTRVSTDTAMSERRQSDLNAKESWPDLDGIDSQVNHLKLPFEGDLTINRLTLPSLAYLA